MSLKIYPAGFEVFRPDALAYGERLGATHDAQGCKVEDFGLARNLMLACGATLVQGDALAMLGDVS